MKKKFLVVLLAMVLVLQAFVFADDNQKAEKEYKVPVRLKHYYEDKDSMGNSALLKMAKVVEKDGKFTYTLYTSKMVFSKLEGSLTNMFVFETNKDSKRVEATKKNEESGEFQELNGKKVPYNQAFIFTRDSKEEMLEVAVWVDVMDNMKGGKPGDGEQLGKLAIDWSKAELVKKEEPKEDKDPKNTDKPTAELFTDVATSDWFYEAVAFCNQNKYFLGGTDGRFMPENSITRADFLTVLGRIAKIDNAAYSGSNFNDVDASKYYAPAIKWAVEKELVRVTDMNKFNPTEALSRQEMAYIMNQYINKQELKFEEKEFEGFKDEAKIDDWAKDSVLTLAKKGVVRGNKGLFDPQGTFTRAQVAQVLFNILK